MLREDMFEDQLILQLQALYSTNRLPAGLERFAKFDVARTLHGELVAQLLTYALSDQAGPVERDVHIYDVAKFPRWLPKWLQRRWVTSRHVTLEVTPRYIYPEANVVIPRLGDSTAIYMDIVHRGEA